MAYQAAKATNKHQCQQLAHKFVKAVIAFLKQTSGADEKLLTATLKFLEGRQGKRPAIGHGEHMHILQYISPPVLVSIHIATPSFSKKRWSHISAAHKRIKHTHTVPNEVLNNINNVTDMKRCFALAASQCHNIRNITQHTGIKLRNAHLLQYQYCSTYKMFVCVRTVYMSYESNPCCWQPYPR